MFRVSLICCLLVCCCESFAADLHIHSTSNVSLKVDAFSSQENHTMEKFNRMVYGFNDKVDLLFFQPVAYFYNQFFPVVIRQGVTNFFSNIDNLSTLANDILQFKFYDSARDGWRLIVNSTIGVFGLLDVASKLGVKPHHEDFGLTLARWGYKNSSYVMVPFLGPSTVRDIIGWPVDFLFLSVYPYINNSTVSYSIYGVGMLNRRSSLLKYQDVMKRISLDKYVFTRNAYMQHRFSQVQDA